MPMKGTAALAMWWRMDAPDRAEFEHWHTSEHFPERLGVPGFLRGTRWVSESGEASYFVVYELRNIEVLGSSGYLERVNQPTPWSAAIMARFRGMIRSPCRVLGSRGEGLGGYLLSLRFSAVDGQEQALHDWVLAGQLPAAAAQPGLCGAHLLKHVPPAGPAPAPTAEQKVRGGDGHADSVLLINAYSLSALRQWQEQQLTPGIWMARGAAPGQLAAIHVMSFSEDAAVAAV